MNYKRSRYDETRLNYITKVRIVMKNCIPDSFSKYAVEIKCLSGLNNCNYHVDADDFICFYIHIHSSVLNIL